MSFRKDGASSVLRRISEIWQIDTDRVSWQRDDHGSMFGFDWWPGDFCVRVRAVSSPDHVDLDDIKISIQTDFLKGLVLPSDRFSMMVADFSRFSTSCFAWIYPPVGFQGGLPSPNSRLWLGGSAYLNENNASWMTELIANLGVVQPISAQIQAAGMAEILGSGTPDKTKPSNSASPELDGILEVVDQVHAPLGGQPSRFANTGEFEEFAATYAQSHMCFGFGDAAGMTLETPFGADSALIRLRTDERHPQLGYGLLITLQLPWFDEQHEIAKQIADLNMLEMIQWTGFPQLGCWHYAEGRGNLGGPAFTLFIPNALYKPGLATQGAFWFLHRARWVREQKFPTMKDRTMLEILKERFGDA